MCSYCYLAFSTKNADFYPALRLIWSGDQTQCFEERLSDVPLADEVSEDPDTLEHVDAVEKDDHHAVLGDVEDEGGDNFQIPVEAHHEEQPFNSSFNIFHYFSHIFLPHIQLGISDTFPRNPVFISFCLTSMVISVKPIREGFKKKFKKMMYLYIIWILPPPPSNDVFFLLFVFWTF